MPACVNLALCDGCRGRAEAECRRVCPADIVQLNPATGKAEVIERDGCWECFACVKACPGGAIEVRGAGDVLPLGGRLVPRRGDAAIHWEVTFRNGEARAFEFPIRTTAWGTIEPFAGMAAASADDLHSSRLCGELRARAAAMGNGA